MTESTDPHGSAQFVLAIKRDARAAAPADWIERVRGTPGVTVVGDANPKRVQIRATAAAIRYLDETLSAFVHIERVVIHERS